MTTYKEFTARMVVSYRRIKESVTSEGFASQVTSRFGLMLTDDSVQGIAEGLGWSDVWLQTVGRRPKAPPPKSGDLAAMFAPALSGQAVAKSPPSVGSSEAAWLRLINSVACSVFCGVCGAAGQMQKSVE